MADERGGENRLQRSDHGLRFHHDTFRQYVLLEGTTTSGLRSGGLISPGVTGACGGVRLDAEAVEEGPPGRGKLHADLATHHGEGVGGEREGGEVRGIAGGDEGDLHLDIAGLVQAHGVIRGESPDLRPGYWSRRS